MNIQPFFRTPFTDIFANLYHFQDHRQCAALEMRTVECLEAYGFDRGLKQCSDLVEDFRECVSRCKQRARCDIMVDERERQYQAGERKKRADDTIPADVF